MYDTMISLRLKEEIYNKIKKIAEEILCDEGKNA